MSEPSGSHPIIEDRIRRTEDPGAPPGTLTTEPGAKASTVQIFSYDPDGYEEVVVHSVPEIRDLLGRRNHTWVNVEGVGDVEQVEAIGQLFGLHHLTLEDVVHVHQRAKVEYYPEYVFIIARMVNPGLETETEQLGIVLGKDYVLTFQEGLPGDCLDPVRDRVRIGRGQIRQRGVDYLAYALLDTVVDYYFPLLETYGDSLEELEDEVFDDAGSDATSAIYGIKRALMGLRRTIRPTQEAVAQLSREENPLITKETRVYLRDVYDHTHQILDHLDTYRDMAAGLIDLHLSLAGHRMNEVMKVLTVIGSVFIPLTFVTGLYGMNFERSVSASNMPELGWSFGYIYVWGLMIAMTAGLLYYFYRRGWLSRKDLR